VLKPSAIRSRLQTALLAALGSAWAVSRHSYDVFPDGRDSRELEHKAFAIGLPQSRPIQGGGRQASAVGVYSGTVVGIRFSFRLRVDAVSADYNEALDAEHLIVQHGVRLKEGASANPELGPALLSIDRTTSPDGLHFLGHVQFLVPHRYTT